MLSSKILRSFFGMAAVAATVVSAQGCVADRPSRNGVFDENQYIRKDFLVQPGTGGGDPGWYMKATIVQTSTPNPLAAMDMFTGAESQGTTEQAQGMLVRFIITSDKLQIADMREMSTDPNIDAQQTRTPEIINAWPITNVDLKYRVNLDGEKTNFYEENQELDWQLRQWVKLNFDKNDLSDLAGLGPYQALMIGKCADMADSSTTIVPNTFLVDEPNNYMTWTIQVTAPINITDADCMTQFGSVGQDFIRMNRSTVTMNIMYSMVRAQPVDPTQYTPFVIDEKDPILHKYGPITITNFSRDPSSGLVAAQTLAVRYNPNKPIVWYFAQGFPEDEKTAWTRQGGIVDSTNAIFKKSGATATLKVLNYNDAQTLGDAAGPARQYGDIRYSFIRWESDLDTDSPFFAVTQYQPDPRTGEIISASINVADEPLKDYLATRLQAYLEAVVGYDPSNPATDLFADPPPDPSNPGKTLSSSCSSGDFVSLASPAVQANIFSQSTLYQKMALYLPKPEDGATAPGPMDYVYQHTGAIAPSFYSAYAALQPYITYADPTLNQYVTPSDLGPTPGIQALPSLLQKETAFQQAVYDIDHAQSGIENGGSGAQGMLDLYNKIDAFRQAWQGHRDYVYQWKMLPHSLMRGDTADLVSFTSMAQRGSRMCVNGKWESQSDWVNRLLTNEYAYVQWHEFGHVMGLEHNFYGSIDRANWPTYTAPDGTTQYAKLSSSVMEYSQSWDDAGWNSTTATWLPYDQAAIAFIYGNDLSQSKAGPQPYPTGTSATSITGQVSPTVPWNDPYGFSADGKTEDVFLYCSHQHMRFTPLCRPNDVGSTPAEITAADIESYDWNFKWRNYRNYYKTWDDAPYGSTVADMISESRRFLALDVFDWSASEIVDKLIRIGVQPPADAVNVGLYYQSLSQEFLADVGAAEELVAAWHEGIIQQSSGQRPYLTQFDPYFGDVTQQGIAIDKELAFTNWLGLWEYDMYDPSQANGLYGSALVIGPENNGGTGGTVPSQSWSTASSMLGEKGPWDAFPGFFPTAVSLFAHDTQTATFAEQTPAYPQMRDWIGGHTFTREQDVLDYFKNIAVQNPHAAIFASDPLATDPGGDEGCTSFATCTYNPMLPQQTTLDIGHSNPITQAFIGPDNRRWTWVYLNDRNIWFFVDQDRNPSSYYQVYTYNQDVNTNYDDGNTPGNVYTYEQKIKYMIDAYNLFNSDTQAQ